MEGNRDPKQSTSLEIPVWYGGAEKWITGIHRRTTCDDVVKALLGSSDPSKDQSDYVLVERWRKVERALDSKSRIMKLWNKWGDERCNVKLSLKRIHQSVPQLKVSSESKENKENLTKHRRHHHRGQGSKYASSGPSSKSWHPKKLEDARDMSDTVDKLIKLIMSQTETISYQLTRLLDKDKQIEQYETQIHELRMTQIGTNYVQDAYLQESSKEPKQEAPKTDDDDDAVETVYRKLLDLLVKLETEENTIVTLEADLKQMKDDEGQQEEVDRLKGELERLEAVYTSRENVLAQNDRFIVDSERTVHEKQDIIDRLEVEILDADKETDRLQCRYEALLRRQDDVAETGHRHLGHEQSKCASSENSPTDCRLGVGNSEHFVDSAPAQQTAETPLMYRRIMDEHSRPVQQSTTAYMNQKNFDRNVSPNQDSGVGGFPSPVNSSPVNCKGETESVDSDTGLSSLHSSSDEATYVLDTLV